jgi:hypothetical protein
VAPFREVNTRYNEDVPFDGNAAADRIEPQPRSGYPHVESLIRARKSVMFPRRAWSLGYCVKPSWSARTGPYPSAGAEGHDLMRRKSLAKAAASFGALIALAALVGAGFKW